MDGASFDRLSRIVHRLRHHTTRRQALRTLAVGGVAGLLARLEAEDARAACTARRHRCSRDGECCGRDVVCDALPGACDRSGDRCCGRSDATCSSKCDCCKGLTCSGGRCRTSSDGGGDCGGTTCSDGLSCCTISGFHQCIDRDYLRCCGSIFCPRSGECCGDGCCSSDQKCCSNGRCCPKGWRCGKTACFTSLTADISAESAQSVPFAEPVKSDEQRWIELGWMTAPEPE
jgi:hypothetical protein